MSEHKTPRKKKIRIGRLLKKLVRFVILLAVLAAVALFGLRYYIRKQHENDGNTTKLIRQEVLFGEMEDTVFGSGTTKAKNQPNITAETEGTLTDLRVSVGDTVRKDEILGVITNDDIDDEITSLEYALWDLDRTITNTKAGSNVTEIESPAAGRIMAIYADKGDDALAVFRREGALALISTDGRMKIEIDGVDAPLGLTLNEVVEVTGKGVVTEGTVTDLTRQGTHAVITILSDEYALGTEVVVSKEDGTDLGIGYLEINKPMAVSSYGGTVKSVHCTVGKEVKREQVLFKLEDSPLSLTMENLRIQREDAARSLSEAKDKREALIILAPCDGVIASLEVEEGDDITDNQILGTILEGEQMDLTIAVDELDVVSVAAGQPVTISIDALPDVKMSGEVYKIAPVGTSSGGVTSYDVELIFDAAGTGVRSGMNATGEIQIAYKEATTYVPVDAIVKRRGETFVMLADGNAASADENAARRGGNHARTEGESADFSGERPEIPAENAKPQDQNLIEKVRAWLYEGIELNTDQPSYTLVKVEVGMQNDDYAEILSGVTAGQTVLVASDTADAASSLMSMMGGRGMSGMSGSRTGGAPGGMR